VTAATLASALAAASKCEAGCSEKEAVWRSGKLTLYRYKPIARPAAGPPLLIVYALVNRPYMMDLQPDRSLIRGLLSEGLDVYLIDWGDPDGADRYLSLGNYIDDYIGRCVEHIVTTHQVEQLDLLGVCQGGVFSLCYTALHPARVRALVTMVTPIDFQTPADLLSKWVRHIDVARWVGTGNVSADLLNQVFLSLMPFRLMHQKYIDLQRGVPDQARIDNFMRVERWIFEGPDLAGAALVEYVTKFYQENQLVRNQLHIGGRALDFSRLTLPLLNLFGKRDHLVPPAASMALQRLTSSANYKAIEFDVGPIGMYISARAQQEVPSAIARWLASH
jgi:polyhydroxyalkanoate synthase subunit PhaC